ncbi:MAG: lytic transglycosylase domain-containing protein [Candidatus Binatia bacterium]
MKRFTTILVALLATSQLSTGVPVASASSIVHPDLKPSRTQMQRLVHLEPYIRYFSSLAYGPNDARVSPEYIRALILTESSGHVTARSGKGARGLTQIIPSTARTVMRKLASVGYDFLYVDEDVFENFHAEDLYNPALNILIACYLSATYHGWYEGSTDLVVSAWNAGPGAVARYGNEVPPYKETRGMIIRLKSLMSYLGQGNIN